MFRPEILALMIPITALMIPIVAILTQHQRRMAELYHSQNQNHNQAAPELAELRREMNELKQLMHQQAIALDNLANNRPISQATPDLTTRVGGAN